MKKLLFISIFSLLLVNQLLPQPLKKISFATHWVPQAQFAGYYVGLEKGIYKKYGIDLSIINGGPKVSSASLLKEGKVDFSLMWLTNAIQLKSKGADIVNITQVVNRSSLMLVSKKSSGIKSPKDMAGKKVGIWGGDFQIQPMAFFKQYNLNVETILQGNSINLFFFDGIDVTSAMWYNEYHTILNSGFDPKDLNTFFFSDYGLNFPEEGIYCNEKLLKEDPELCAKFVQATFESWIFAFNNPEEAVDIILKNIRETKLTANKTHQKWMLARMKDLILIKKDMDEFDILKEDSYKLVSDKLKENNLISSVPKFENFYKPVRIVKSR